MKLARGKCSTIIRSDDFIISASLASKHLIQVVLYGALIVLSLMGDSMVLKRIKRTIRHNV